MANKGCYVLSTNLTEVTTDQAATFNIYTSGDDMTGVTYTFGYEFVCDGVTTTKTVASSLTASTYSFTPTTAVFAPLMTKSETGTLRIKVETVNGQHAIYIRDLTLKLKDSIKPAVSSVTIARTNPFNSKSVSNITTHKLSFNVAGLYGAAQTVNITIGDSKYTKEVSGVSGTTATSVSFDIGSFDAGTSASVTKSIAINVTDARGRTGSSSTSVVVYKYTPPVITSATVERNESEQPVLTYTYSYQSTVAGATNSLKQFYARCVVGETVNQTDLKSKTSPQVLTGTYDIAKSYTFLVLIQDSVRPSAIFVKAVLPSARPVLDIGADGNTVTFFGTSPSSATKETLRVGEVASFGEEIILSPEGESEVYVAIGNGALRLYDPNNGYDFVHLGLGTVTTSSNTTITDWYASLGTRNSSGTIGQYSCAEGFSNIASGMGSHAEGVSTQASGKYAHAEGYSTKASGELAHAEGSSTTASGIASHAEGSSTRAQGANSHAGGLGTKADGDNQTVIGKYNINYNGYYAFIIGNGESSSSPSNAFAVTWNGGVDLSGGIYMTNGQYIYGKDSDGNNVQMLGVNSNNTLALGGGKKSSATGDTRIYGGDSLYLGLGSPDTAWTPYFAKGQSVSGVWWGAGFISSSSKNVYFTIPLSRPIVGSPTVTVTSNQGLMIRQNNSYLYGGSASAYVKPSSYTATSSFNGSVVRITAVMPNTTNATNNSPCAISADIKITFS